MAAYLAPDSERTERTITCSTSLTDSSRVTASTAALTRRSTSSRSSPGLPGASRSAPALSLPTPATLPPLPAAGIGHGSYDQGPAQPGPGGRCQRVPARLASLA